MIILSWKSAHASLYFILQELRDEILAKESTLNKLTASYERLSPADSSLVETEVGPLRETWNSLVDEVTELLSRRHDALDQCRDYQHKQDQVDRDLQAFAKELSAIQKDKDKPVLERLQRLKVGWTSLLKLNCAVCQYHAWQILNQWLSFKTAVGCGDTAVLH